MHYGENNGYHDDDHLPKCVAGVLAKLGAHGGELLGRLIAELTKLSPKSVNIGLHLVDGGFEVAQLGFVVAQ